MVVPTCPLRRYLQMFTPIEPTAHNICQFNFEKDAAKIRDLRPDTLSQIMSLANVRPGAKLLVVEDLHGMMVAAAVERMGGTLTCSILFRFATKKQPSPLLPSQAKAASSSSTTSTPHQTSISATRLISPRLC